MKNETIYMVQLGENYEGVHETAIHATLEGAEAKALEWMEDSCADDWRETTPGRTEVRSWAGGCDWIHIVTEEIGD